MDKVLISVITVCINAEKEIDDTINSILNQDYTGYEYLIKDGGSLDSTLEIAEKYRDCFQAKGIPFRIISEKDEGLYDAMNCSAAQADGEWIIFINAGDAIYDEHVLSRLSDGISDEADVLYGDAVLTENGMYKLLKAAGKEKMKNFNPICHQASLTRTEALRKYGFDTQYEIAADFDLFVKIALADGTRLKKLDLPFCIFLLGGTSNSRVSLREKEFDAVRKHNGLKRVAFPHLQSFRIVCVSRLRNVAKKILGERFYSEKRGWYPDKTEAVKNR